MQVTRIDQIAVVVHDLDEALAEYKELFGMVPVSREFIDDAGLDEAMIDIGGVYLQLIAPTRPDSVVARFLEQRGPGLHHIGFAVNSVGGALDDLRAKGAPLIDQVARTGGGGHEIAFVHPLAVSKVLVELVGEASPADSR